MRGCCGMGLGAMGGLADKFDGIAGMVVPLAIAMIVTLVWNDFSTHLKTKTRSQNQAVEARDSQYSDQAFDDESTTARAHPRATKINWQVQTAKPQPDGGGF